jgi:hypothetical protein
MTFDQFRSEEGLRLELATFLRSPTGLIAVSLLRSLARPVDVPSGTDALASARVLSQYHGYSAAIDDLERLATPAVSTSPLPEPSFGADMSEKSFGDHLPSQFRSVPKQSGEVNNAPAT